jgi:hypothetical protein
LLIVILGGRHEKISCCCSSFCCACRLCDTAKTDGVLKLPGFSGWQGCGVVGSLAFFTSNNIQIKTIEKDSGVIYAERARADPSMADCGQDLAVELSRPANLNVFVKEASGGTQVTVNANFEVVRTFDNRTWNAPCHSTGLLEKQILSSIKSKT